MQAATVEREGQLSYGAWRRSTRAKSGQPALTEAQRSRPFAKYLDDPIEAPDPAHVALMDEPCDPAKAIGPERINDLLDPGYLEVEIGWCNLPDGTGFIANRMLYPDITAEMIDWWFAWHTLEDLRYRIWYPPQHAGIMISPASRARILDPNVPIAQKNWGVVHHVTENCDNGMDNIDIRFMSPQDFGFDMSRWKKPHVAAFAGGEGWAVSVDKTDESITAPALMCHIFREVPGGLEHRTRFWMGCRMSQGRPESTLPPGVRVPREAVQGLARHNVKEFTRFKTFLPRVHAEFGDRFEV
jgi:phloretin hydrolase